MSKGNVQGVRRLKVGADDTLDWGSLEIPTVIEDSPHIDETNIGLDLSKERQIAEEDLAFRGELECNECHTKAFRFARIGLSLFAVCAKCGTMHEIHDYAS